MFSRMLALIISLFVGSLVVAGAIPYPPQIPLFYSPNATEALVEFDHRVVYPYAGRPTAKEARAQIDFQIQHLYGPMAASRIPGVQKGDYKLSNIKITKASIGYEISYHYQGTMLLSKGASKAYELILPLDPDRIYETAQTMVRGEIQNPCTDEHYQSKDDFWYFWNPYQKGCRLKEGKDFEIVKAGISRKDNTVQTFPEYSRLLDANRVLKVSILFGMDDPAQRKDPRISEDYNAATFRSLREVLLESGFRSRQLSRSEIYEIVPKGTHPLPYIEEFEKVNKLGNLRIQASFSPSAVDKASSKGFHYVLKDALEHSAVVIYDGHSGLGANLDIERINEEQGFEIRPPKDRYQIYYFDSCSSYSYYSTTFFALKTRGGDKLGTQNLDILANGLETLIDGFPKNSMVVIDALNSWTMGAGATSYQQLARQLDDGDLFSVLGDEDNSSGAPVHAVPFCNPDGKCN